VVAQIERNGDAGVHIACDLVQRIRESNAFDGVHLIPTARYRAVAARLDQSD
jgi:hypothetical protein